ncbi:DNA polymerase IV [Ectobacillus sp. JY-23]|uniref:DNA polymerase IV n=1 Tax=Ectobacillus sp. JY-23 TaxID=2933872 RepID=UPI001FF3B472|nr:DNA polymerase IV [Ectobacillus sp. JY-23]UOY93908.1 DNA polymerase IV [Ectobacillus sp. JY-23]
MEAKEMYPKKGRVILHVDMNCFYASVEAVNDSSLKGKPLAIAGNEKERKGIIVTCSYEARAQGVRATMPLWEARRLCPELIVKRPNFELYRSASAAFFTLLLQFTDKVQPISIDEGYLDITECHELGTPLQIAKTIQQEVMQQLGLPCSIGVAPNKFLAKMASDMKKPLGITVLRKRDISDILWPKHVLHMHGVGEKTAEKLKSVGIESIGDLAHAQDYLLRHILGVNGPILKQKANGIDKRPVETRIQAKTIGSSRTLPIDTGEEAVVYSLLEELASMVNIRLRKRNLITYNLQLTIKYHNRRITHKSRQLLEPIETTSDLFAAACRLWRAHWNGEAVRLLGITATELADKDKEGKQLDLFSFEADAKEEPLMNIIATLRNKYGEGAVQRGIHTYKTGVK